MSPLPFLQTFPVTSCWVYRDYLLPFLVVVLVFAFFCSHFAEDKLLVLGHFKSRFAQVLHTYYLWWVARPFLGPAHLGLIPLGSFSRVNHLVWFPAHQGLTPLGFFSLYCCHAASCDASDSYVVHWAYSRGRFSA